jgi:hypothetical protein
LGERSERMKMDRITMNFPTVKIGDVAKQKEGSGYPKDMILSNCVTDHPYIRFLVTFGMETIILDDPALY